MINEENHDKQTSTPGQDEVAIRVINISKNYHIYNCPKDRLKQFLHPYISKLTGRESPNYYHNFNALKDISFEVNRSETVGIVGRNGSGKSTLLQIICGTLPPSTGMIETYGQVAALLELGSGFNHEFTGRENVYMNASILGLTTDQVDEKFNDIVAFANIGEYIEQPIQSYSSGMIVRLAFAIQAMIDPDILVIDEALAVGDEKFQRKCFARLEQLKNRGSSILFVSHSEQQINELCDRVILLDKGECLMIGDPKDTVGFYQRLLYAPEEEQKRLKSMAQYPKTESGTQEEQEPDEVDLLNKIDMEEGFDQGLISQTSTVYHPKGAQIEKFMIVNAQGREVNVLQSGRKYKFMVSGRLLSCAAGVHFGLHIRTISGVGITGQRYPENGRSINIGDSDRKFRIVFEFNLNLLPGVYFVGGGVWSDHGSDCMHRILDALMFRVISNDAQQSFGYCDLASDSARLTVSES